MAPRKSASQVSDDLEGFKSETKDILGDLSTRLAIVEAFGKATRTSLFRIEIYVITACAGVILNQFF